MSGIGQTVTEKREGAIWKEEALLQELIEQVSEKVVNLERRLVPILRSEPPKPEDGAEKAQQAVPDLVGRLENRVCEVRRIQFRLGSLLDRLEI